MRTIRSASYDEFVTWYLRREYSKCNKAIPPLGTMLEQRSVMHREHSGKILPWFPTADWTVVDLHSESDLFNLVCLASRWTRESGLLRNESLPDSRILSTFVRHAIESNYFGEPDRPILYEENMAKRQSYITRLLANPPMRFIEDNRVILCSLSHGEKSSNPSGTYYLHDGLGRMLAYTYLISRKQLHFAPVEAFLVINRQS